MKQTDLEQTFSFFNEIGIIAQLANNALQASFNDDMTLSQFAVLNWFARVDDIATPGRLAKAFMVTRGAMTNTLKKLEAKGFVTVEPDAESGRRKLVKVTPAGRRARTAALKAAEPLLKELLEQFSVKQMQQHLPFLTEVRSYLDERRY